MAELKFQTTLKEVPVEIDGMNYVIRELNGLLLSAYRKGAGGDVTLVDGKATISNLNIQDPELRLLSCCIYDEKGILVPKNVINSWPATVLDGLYDAASKLSGLDKESREKQEAEAKNS